jgi:hypothetical protein
MRRPMQPRYATTTAMPCMTSPVSTAGANKGRVLELGGLARTGTAHILPRSNAPLRSHCGTTRLVEPGYWPGNKAVLPVIGSRSVLDRHSVGTQSGFDGGKIVFRSAFDAGRIVFWSSHSRPAVSRQWTLATGQDMQRRPTAHVAFFIRTCGAQQDFCAAGSSCYLTRKSAADP